MPRGGEVDLESQTPAHDPPVVQMHAKPPEPQPREPTRRATFRKSFAKAEMNDDLLIVPARYGDEEDNSEYQETLPTSPP